MENPDGTMAAINYERYKYLNFDTIEICQCNVHTIRLLTDDQLKSTCSKDRKIYNVKMGVSNRRIRIWMPGVCLTPDFQVPAFTSFFLFICEVFKVLF